MRRPQVAGAPVPRPVRLGAPVGRPSTPQPTLSALQPVQHPPQTATPPAAPLSHPTPAHHPVPQVAASAVQQPSVLRPATTANMDMRSPSSPVSPKLQPQQPSTPRHGSFGAGVMHAGQQTAQPPTASVSVSPVLPQPGQATPQPQQAVHPHAAAIGKEAAEHHQRKEPHPTAHAGLIGFGVFVVLGILCFAPMLPGKIWHDAPGSSQAFSTGDQNLSCLGTLGPVTTTESFDTKLGFPVVYNYATTSHMRAECGGKAQTAVGGHTSQFNPIAVAIDFAIPLGLSIITAKLWRKFRSTD